jgi:hypothetical protein
MYLSLVHTVAVQLTRIPLFLPVACRYRQAWETFISRWYAGLTGQQRQEYSLTKAANGSIRISAAGALKALRPDGAWVRWATQQLQAAQQQVGSSAGHAGSSSSAPASNGVLESAQQQVALSAWAGRCVHEVHDYVLVNGVRFVGRQRSAHRSQGWAVLVKEPGISSMWFVEVLDTVSQTTPAGTEHIIVLCHKHESKPADVRKPGPALDADGLIVFPSAPSPEDGSTIVAVPAAKLVPLRLTVVEHMDKVRHPDKFVALKHIPYVDFVRQAGFPESSGYVGV